MSRKISTVHILDMADSLIEQNKSIGLLIASIEAAYSMSSELDAEQLRKLISTLHSHAEKCKKAFWPD